MAISMLDFRDLVNRTADRFELQTGVPVTPPAREALITPALPHQQQVEQEIRTGRVTKADLQGHIFTVLQNAESIARGLGRDVIDEEEVLLSMRTYCPYIFWC